jgi:hypothetical protein
MAKRLSRNRLAACVIAAGSLLAAVPAEGQQTTINSPLNTAGQGYYENIGTRWGVQGKGWFFNFGGPAPIPGGFGGFNPGGGPNFGAGFGNGGGSGFFQLWADQGSSSTISSQSPSVTVMNGGTGYFADVVQRPFVMGLVPVVGGAPPAAPVSPLVEKLDRLQGEPSLALGSKSTPPAAWKTSVPGGGVPASEPSTAERGDLSVAEIKANQAAAAAVARHEVDALIAKASGAEAAGQFVSARLYYEMAARKTTGDEQRALHEKAAALDRR